MHNLWGLDPDLAPVRIEEDARAAVTLFMNGYSKH
jgi:hypothetical protein